MEENQQIYPQVENTNGEPTPVHQTANADSTPVVISEPTPASPTPLSLEKPYAGFIIRWAASTIDGIIVWIISGPIYLFEFLVFKKDTSRFLTTLIVLIVIWSYYVVLTKKYKATSGKRFFKLRVESAVGRPLTWIRVFLRETIGKFLSSILMLGFIWAIFDKRKQTWHDKIAGTVVIQNEPLSKGRRIFAYILAWGLPVIALLGIAAVIFLVAVNPLQQLARTRDAGRKASVSQLGHAMQSYYQTNGQFPEQTNNWITNLVSKGQLQSVPAEIVNTQNPGAKCTAAGAMLQNGYCLETSATDAIVYTPLESESEKRKCNITEGAWYVYDTTDGRAGTVCAHFFVEHGPQKFVD